MPFLGKTPAQGFVNSVTKDDFTPNGTTTAFTLSKSPATVNEIEVYVGNVRQEPTDAYSVSGTTLTMTEAPATGTNFYVMHIGGTTQSSTVLPGGSTVPGDFNVSGTLTAAGFTGFTSTGIDDNATSNAITIDASENVNIATTVATDNRNTAGIHIAALKGVSFQHYAANAASRNWRIRTDDNGPWGSFNISRGTTQTEIPNTAALIITKDGEVTKPSQPCFSATAATTNIPVTTSTTVTLSSERFDVGNNLTNNIFTAPITGKYLFTYIYYISNLDAGHTTFDAHILTSNKQYQQTFKPSVFMNSDGNFGVSGSVIADMDINDTCRFKVYVAGGAAQTDIHADSHVSGCLLF